ncbi:hypothetical protein [Streptomyces sp. NPDC047123]|uniref:hypothetical protein n=1 Tax=Streptomyces sp. NPDC047123 TaxID=3155622 RepID=UPI0033E11ECF
MPTNRADAAARHTGRLLCLHLALAMSLTAGSAVFGVDDHRLGLYLLWAALPLSAAAWALARFRQKRVRHEERSHHVGHPADWESVA